MAAGSAGLFLELYGPVYWSYFERANLNQLLRYKRCRWVPKCNNLRDVMSLCFGIFFYSIFLGNKYHLAYFKFCCVLSSK